MRFTLSSTIVNLISDVAILLLPQKVIWALHVSKIKVRSVFRFQPGISVSVVRRFSGSS